MKYETFVIAFLLLLASFTSHAHDYHASITDVTFNPRTQSLEVAVKVFTDDLENALSLRSKSNIAYSNSEKVQQHLREYVQASLSFEVEKGKPLKQKFLGAEEETDAIWIYVEVPVNANSLSQLYVRNAVLTELFNDQMNVMNVTYKGKVNSVLLQKHDSTKRMTF